MTALDANAVAQYLADHPHFFDDYAGLLGEVRLASPVTGRAVSLQERQMEVMRDKYRALELRLAELVRVAQDNAAIANRFHAWNQILLTSRDLATLPRALADGLASKFNVPQVTLRLWNTKPEHAGAWFTEDVSDDARIFAGSLRAPYCGPNRDFEAVRWLGDAAAVRSVVILPLASGDSTFGLLILGSPDPDRFSAQMGTDFLVHIGETASAALAPLVA
ncbi:DUF484 family protein [Massilia terrae]|uniref:DUF484 family protein n=1 Tax=Massilia terrae TaxID=1811224 RepID=A0ABT2CYD4_9BURK|nr:DUF484 family protein [Massilia terrae]MCS0658825.1 DUF484 family protein [Massilia terrae]